MHTVTRVFVTRPDKGQGCYYCNATDPEGQVYAYLVELTAPRPQVGQVVPEGALLLYGPMQALPD